MKSMFKRLLALGLSAMMVMSLAACGGGSSNGGGAQTPAGDEGGAQTEDPAGDDAQEPAGDEGGAAPAADGGTIMWLSNLSSGPQYDAYVAYGTEIAAQLGYNFQVVYADPFNDPAGNLSAVQTGMTSDVVAIIASQDGGITNIMEEYPDLYVVGFASDMASVYSEGGASAAALSNDKWLGTIVDGWAHGEDTGHEYAQAVIEGGYKKVATLTFPSYAYPQAVIGADKFREEIEAYNATVGDDEKIEVVGENKILEFAPLEESWFMEGDNSDLDAIVGMLASSFVYPTMVSAKASGLCSADTKLLTSGFETGADMIADIGGDGTIQFITISPVENIAWALVLVDNALQGAQYADFSADRIDSARYVIDSAEDIANVMEKSLCGTADPSKAQITFEDLQSVLTRYTPDATYAQLNELFHSDKILVDALQ